MKRRRRSATSEDMRECEEICLFCNQPAGASGLREASTFGLDRKVREAAIKLNKTDLLAKLSAGDMMAIKAKYHVKCLQSLYNEGRSLDTGTSASESNPEQSLHGIAFAALVSYLEEFRDCCDETVPVVKLASLVQLYATKLQELGVPQSSIKVNSTRLKERLLATFPDLGAHKQGKHVVLMFNHAIGDAKRKACEKDFDSEALHLARAASIVRRDMFSMKQTFRGIFEADCQKQSIPASLLALVDMILEGPSIKKEMPVDKPVKTAAVTISHLLAFNSCKYGSGGKKPTSTRHSREKEYPFPVYAALKIHGETRKKTLVDAF